MINLVGNNFTRGDGGTLSENRDGVGGKATGLSSLPLAQFLADVSQLHSKSITETFAEIMIKTLASCQFHVIRDIFSPPFFICHRLSKLDATELSAFVQTADIICCQKGFRSILSKSTSTCVVHHFQSHRALMGPHGADVSRYLSAS